MKTINFNTAYNGVTQIAASVNQDYYSVFVEKNSKNGTYLKAYINGYGFTKECVSVKELLIAVSKMVKTQPTENVSINNITI